MYDESRFEEMRGDYMYPKQKCKLAGVKGGLGSSISSRSLGLKPPVLRSS
jgi:hypothetical protein